ncbi:PR domain-containing protein 11 [Armadillidium vulgare]|nr:PR domain-containing protein 11 [Armadillidium vulgare]
MRYVNCSRSDREANLSAFQFKGEMYYKTITEIKRDEELLIWYGDKYGKKLAYSLEITKYETALTISEKVGIESSNLNPVILNSFQYWKKRNQTSDMVNIGIEIRDRLSLQIQ